MKIIKKIVEKFPNEQKIVLSRYKDQTKELKRIFGDRCFLFCQNQLTEKNC